MNDFTGYSLQDLFKLMVQAEKRGFIAGVTVSVGVMMLSKSWRMVRSLERLEDVKLRQE